MTQTIAIFVDAYRSLNSKKLFWVVLAISALVVIALGCVGINERGITIFAWQIDCPLNTQATTPAVFYKQMFVSGGIGFWLSWLATILALISTAGIFPDLIGSGAIDLMVSKPIGRLRLFLTEYVAGLLFVTLQVAVFCLASFLVIGLRGGVWEPALFLAVPLVVCFFSYLFSVCVLLGVLTRSTVAALLLTLLFWFFVYGIAAAEQTVLMFRMMEKHRVAFGPPEHTRPAVADAADRDSAIRATEAKKGSGAIHAREAKKSGAADAKEAKKAVAIDTKRRPEASGDRAALAEPPPSSAGLETAYNILHAVVTVLPKTGETIGLLQRWLVSLADLPHEPASPQRRAMESAQRELVETLYQRSPFWIIGTSLGFECVMLAWAAWLFCRRDF